MDKLLYVPLNSPIVARVQRIRKRMIIEQVSGILVSDKDIFLSLCHQYEQHLIDIECAIAGKTFWLYRCAEHPWLHQCEDDWMKWDDNWKDWHKFYG